MSPLFLKISAKKYFALWVILSFCSGVLANDNIQDTIFKEHCKTSDAYFLYYYTDVSYSFHLFNNIRQTSVQSKLVVNNKSGVEKYAFLNISKFVDEHINTIQIKTLKADGTVMNLDSTLIFKNGSNDDQTGWIYYPISGVEPGDTIEVTYIYAESLENYKLMDYVNLFNNVPSLITRFTITTPVNLLVRYKTYNGFPEPEVLSNDTLLQCLFKMENINSLSENQYTCLACELPYMYYSMEYKYSKIATWKDVYNMEYNIITQPVLLDNKNLLYYEKWKKSVIGGAGDSSKYYKLNVLLADIYNTVQMVPLKESELFESSGYFLKKKYFNPISIQRLYRQILEDLEIEYYAVFARSKRLGNIDPYYIRNGECDHIFFAFTNSKGTLSLLYPHDLSFKYLIDEIPTSLFNTEAVIVKPLLNDKIHRGDKFINSDLKLAEADSLTINVIKLPGMGVNYNFLKQVFNCEVDVNNKIATFKSNFSVSGGLSTDLRKFFSLLSQNKEINDFYAALAEFEGEETALKIDTITDVELNYARPYVYSISAQGSLTKSLSFINDSIVSITLDKLIKPSQIKSEADSTSLNYYLDYCYTDFCTLILKFPCNIELLSFEKYNRETKNNCGEYSFNLNLVTYNQLIIQSFYKINKDIIPKDEYGQLKELNDIVQEIQNMRLLIKLKEP